MIGNPFNYVQKTSSINHYQNRKVSHESMICRTISIHSDCKTGLKEILFDSYDDYSGIHTEF